MVRVMHAGALDGFRNYHVDIHTVKEEVIFIHLNPPTESRKSAVCIKQLLVIHYYIISIPDRWIPRKGRESSTKKKKEKKRE